MSPIHIFELLILGTCAGFLAGLLGVGGSLVMVPVILWVLQQQGVEVGIAVHAAIATSLATILFTSLSSVRAHHKKGAVQWPLVWRFTPGILIGSYIGSRIGLLIGGTILMLVFSFFLIFSALQMWFKLVPTASRTLPSTPCLIGAGGVIGTLAGLMGAGGAFVSVPFMSWCRVPIHHAVGTAAALGFPIALAGTLSNIYNGWGQTGMPPHSLGYLYLPAFLVVAAASTAMAPVGALVAHSMNTTQLKRAFALLLLLLSAYMAQKALRGQ